MGKDLVAESVELGRELASDIGSGGGGGFGDGDARITGDAVTALTQEVT
jgi:hypothetical protein